MDPGHASALDNLARLRFEQPRYEEALRSFERALTLDPANEAAQRNLRQIRGDLGREPGAG